MNEFNHLKNFCMFLCTGSDQVNSVFDDELPFDESEARRLFGEHVFNLMVEPGVDVDEDIANMLADAFEKAFYHAPSIDA